MGCVTQAACYMDYRSFAVWLTSRKAVRPVRGDLAPFVAEMFDR